MTAPSEESASNEGDIAIKPPTLSILLDRWRALALVTSLISELDPDYELIGYKELAGGCVVGRWYDYAGSLAWLLAAGGAGLYLGSSDQHPFKAEGPGIETHVRKAFKRLPPDLVKLVPARPRNSYGWTFALWTPSDESAWIDLTGRDPTAGESAWFPRCEALYGTVDEAVEYVVEQFELANREEAVRAVMRHEALCKSVAMQIMECFSKERAVAVANAMGYPVSSDLQ